MITLQPQLLDSVSFAPFGQVIEAGAQAQNQMNGTFQRFDDLATIEDPATISIVRSQTPTSLPHDFNLVECHPLCSQAFVPLRAFVFYLVVGPAGDTIDAADLRAFVTNGHQGISYFKGTWHMPLIAQAPEQEFLVVDQADLPGNLREQRLPEPIRLNSIEL